MDLVGKKLAVVLVAGIFLALSSFLFVTPSSAYLYGNWASRPTITDTVPPEPGNLGRDIKSFSWAYSPNDYFFRMDLKGFPQNSSSFGFYFDTDKNSGTGGSFFNGTLTGIDLFVRIDKVNTNIDSSGWRNLVLGDGNGNPLSSPDISFLFTNIYNPPPGESLNILEWRISDSHLTNPLFTMWAATTRGGQNYILADLGNPVATPIPNAAWLFGAGVVALIGLKRRKTKT